MILDFKNQLDFKREIRIILDDIEVQSDSHCCYHQDADIEIEGLEEATDRIIEFFEKFLTTCN